MSRNKKPLKSKKAFFKYSEDDMQSAIKAVKEDGCGIRKAARDHGVPHSTLINKLKGAVPLQRKMGPQSYLSEHEEKLLVNWIVSNAKKGFPLKRRSLVDSVSDIIIEDGRETPFVEGRPGKTWFISFLKRHPTIAARYAENMNSAKAAVTETNIRTWFQDLRTYLSQEGAIDILEDSTRIFNADELGFQTCPKTGEVLGPDGFDHLYDVKAGNEKEALTVLANFSAAGKIAPPMIVYPYQEISSEISQNLREDWGFGRSKGGGMTGPLYYEYITNIFYPWLLKNEVKLPVLLLVDGHKSHLTFKLSDFCADVGILQVATHILHPADDSVFRPLKAGWANSVYEWKSKTLNEIVTKVAFAKFLESVFLEHATEDIIKNGFRECGIFPFDPNAVDYSRYMSSDIRRCDPSNGVEHLIMKHGKAKQFRGAESTGWEGDLEATELYQMWKKLQSGCPSSDSTLLDDIPGTSTTVVGSISLDTHEKTSTLTENLSVAASITTLPVSVDVNPSMEIPGTNPSTTVAGSISLGIPEKTSAVTGNLSVASSSTALPVSVDVNPSMEIPGTSITVTANKSSGDNITSSYRATICTTQQTAISPAFANHILCPTESPVKCKKSRKQEKEQSKNYQETEKKKRMEAGNINIKLKKKNEKLKANVGKKCSTARKLINKTSTIKSKKKHQKAMKSRRDSSSSDCDQERNESEGSFSDVDDEFLKILK